MCLPNESGQIDGERERDGERDRERDRQREKERERERERECFLFRSHEVPTLFLNSHLPLYDVALGVL